MAVAEVKLTADATEIKAELESVRAHFEGMSRDGVTALSVLDIHAGDLEASTRAESLAVTELAERFGLISRGQFDAQFERIRAAMDRMREAGVNMGPAWDSARQAMSRLKEQAVASGLYGTEALQELTRETGRSAGGFGKAAAAAAGLAPVIRTAGNIGSNTMRDLLGSVLQVDGALGNFGKAASTLGLKGVEESIEDMTAGMIKGARETGSFSGALNGAKGGLMAAAASGFAVTAVVGALGFAVVKTAGMIREYTKAIAEAERAEMAASQATSRQEQQYDALTARLGMTTAELEKLVGGRGLGAVFAHAAKNPEGIVAQNLNAMGQAAMVANEHTIRYKAALEKLGDGLRSIHPEQLKVEFEALTEVYGRSSKQLQSGLGAASLFSAEIERQINLYRQLGIAAPLALEAMHSSVVVAETRASLANIFPEDIEARTKGIMLAWGDLTGRFHSSSAAVDVLSGTFVSVADEAQRAGVVLDKYFLAQLDQARIREITRGFDDMLPPKIQERIKTLAGAHDELTRSTGSAQTATALLGDAFMKVAGEAELAGVKIDSGFLSKFNAARVEEITKAFASLTPKRVTEEALALVAAFEKLTKQTGSQKTAFELLAPQIQSVEKNFGQLKNSMPEGLPKPFTDMTKEGKKAQEGITGLNETMGYFKERVTDVEYANSTMFGQLKVGHDMSRKLIAQAVADSENWSKKIIEASNKARAAVESVRVSQGLTGEDDVKVEGASSNEGVKRAIGQIPDMLKALSGAGQEVVRAAKGALVEGNISALRKLAEMTRERITAIGMVATDMAGGTGDELRGLSQWLAGLIAQLSRIQPRALGGPVLGGSTYLVGERGPELLRMGNSGGEIIPNVDRVLGARQSGGRTDALLEQLIAEGKVTRAAFARAAEMDRSAEVVAAVKGLSSEIKSRPVVVNIDGKQVARSNLYQNSHNQADIG